MTVRAVVLCDTCPNVFAPEATATHRDLTRQAHEAGWTSTFSHSKWRNECDECANGAPG